MHNQFIQARKRQNLTLEQAHKKTKISTHYLEAIEQGDYAKLPIHIATSYINTYAKLLHVSPKSTIEEFQEYLESKPNLGKRTAVKKRSRVSSKKTFKKKTSVWIGICSLLIVLCGVSWYMVDAFWEEKQTTEDKQVSTSIQQKPEQKTAKIQLPSKDDRALLKLIEPVEVNNKGDRYELSNADKVKLMVTAQKPTQITVNSSKGQKTKKSLQAGDKQTFTDAKSVSIEISAPNQVTLSVNGNIVDTSKQTKIAFYQFSLQDHN